jgi:hypothetical protein
MANFLEFNQGWFIVMLVLIVALIASTVFLLYSTLGPVKIYTSNDTRAANDPAIKDGQFALTTFPVSGIPQVLYRSPRDHLLHSWQPFSEDPTTKQVLNVPVYGTPTAPLTS